MSLLDRTAPPTNPVSRLADRGPVSRLVRERMLREGEGDSGEALALAVADAIASSDGILHDDDLQLAAFLIYAGHYGSLPGLDATLEWDATLIAVRTRIEEAMERELRALVAVAEPPLPVKDEVAAWLFGATAPSGKKGLSHFVARKASVAQLREFLVLRSIYTLREADPHSWAIPRLTGRAKAALVEIQFDEYGSGDPDRVHAGIFAQAMRGVGLDDTYGAYLDNVPAVVLTAQNMMSMFGLNRRLRGAIVGHLAAFEMTSSIPNRFYGDGFRRAGYGEDVTWYFDEHVEADAVHEQIAGRDLAGSLAEDEPELAPDILFGAVACLALDDLVGDWVLGQWENGRSALRVPLRSEPRPESA